MSSQPRTISRFIPAPCPAMQESERNSAWLSPGRKNKRGPAPGTARSSATWGLQEISNPWTKTQWTFWDLAPALQNAEGTERVHKSGKQEPEVSIWRPQTWVIRISPLGLLTGIPRWGFLLHHSCQLFAHFVLGHNPYAFRDAESDPHLMG